MRTLPRFLVLSAWVGLLGSATAAPMQDSADPPRPNIVFIMADDLGWKDVGYAGAEFFETPHIDSLAAEGMTFTAAYSGGPNCSPTRACLMTGTYTPRHHIYTPGGRAKGKTEYMRLLVPAVNRKTGDLAKQADSQFPITNTLDPNFTCIPEMLKTAGYTSARLGKWHLGEDVQGFDLSSSNGISGPRGSHYGEADVTEKLTDRAVRFLEEKQDVPFFLYLSYWDVHTPLNASEDLVKKYRAKKQALPEQERKRFNPVYAAMIEAVDTGVGRVVQKIDELNLKNTLVIFISDNGGTNVSQLEPLRGMKGSLFEAGVRVPACMRWPGRIAAGSTCDVPITSVDFMPTFAALAGAVVPDWQPIDGTDISPLLLGKPLPERSIFWHYPLYLHGKGLDIDLPDGSTYSWRGFPSSAIRRGDWKLIEFHEDRSMALYNLKDDVGEQVDLAAEHPEVAADLLDELHAWQSETNAPIPTTPNPECVLTSTEPIGTPVPEAVAGTGLMIGEVTNTFAVVQVRLSATNRLIDRDLPGAAGTVQFTLTAEGDAADAATPVVKSVTVAPEHDFIAKAVFNELQPGTRYVCSARVGSTADKLHDGPVARFRTLPGSDGTIEARFVVVTGMNHAKFHGDTRINRAEHLLENNTALPPPYAGADKYLGYPALDTIRSMKPDFFIGTGDNVYYDTPSKPRAKTVEELRQKWHEQFMQPRYVRLFAEVPTYWEIDDHDYRIDDCDNSGDYLPLPETGRRMMLEQLPIAAHEDTDAKTYRTHRVTKDLQIWMPENRMYRSPNAMPDGPDKTIWGTEQKAWLKRTLLESDATFKILVSPTPMIGPDDLRKTDNHTNIGGFQHERDEFFQWLVDHELHGRNGFMIVCGDRHWQYHSTHPLGIEEISTGALVDANSRPGRRAGDPKSTDPEGLIGQPYLQTSPSGGFLLVRVTPADGNAPAQLFFEHFDEHGVLLHRNARVSLAD